MYNKKSNKVLSKKRKKMKERNEDVRKNIL